MTITIRAAVPDDLPTLQKIARETISAKFRAFMPAANVDGFINSGASDQYCAEHLPKSWVVIADGTIAGFSVCKDDLIDLMIIDHTRHRQGIGSALLKDCESRLFATHGKIRLDSYETNDQANNEIDEWLSK